MNKSNFHKGAKPVLFGYARQLRKSQTSAEKLLWQELRGDRFLGMRFRRQHPLKNFVLDFFCHQLNLGIEVDGEYHETDDQRDYDLGCTYEVQELGITILRFTNKEIENRLTEVVNTILAFAQTKLKSDLN